MKLARRASTGLLLCLCCFAANALPQRRALVIGNDTYPADPLQNARNDARAIATKLRKLGYATTLAVDVNRTRMVSAVDTFTLSLNRGDDAVIYYAGHGIQVDGENMLVPTDFRATDESGLVSAGYPLSSVLAKLMARGARAKIVILDACRNNPYHHDRSLAAGWSAMHASADAYLAFGTAPGQTASDDSRDGHGLFTSILLKHLDDPVDLDTLFRVVRLDVIKASKGAQTPWTSSSLIDSFHLDPSLDAVSKDLYDELATLDPARSGSETPLRSISTEGLGATSGSNNRSRDVEALTSTAFEDIRSLHLAQALPILEEVLAIDPHAALALRAVGLILSLMGRHEEAQAVLSRAVHLNADDSAALAYLCLADNGITATQCNAGLQAHPESAASHLALAMRFAESGDYRAALPEATTALSLRPDSAATLMLQAHIALATHQTTTAEKDLARANELILSKPQAISAMSTGPATQASPLVSH